MNIKWWWKCIPCTSEVGWLIRSLDPEDGEPNPFAFRCQNCQWRTSDSRYEGHACPGPVGD